MWRRRRWRYLAWHGGVAGFQHQLAITSQGLGNGLFQQGSTALHHAHPVPCHLHDGTVGIQSHQLALLREEHPGGWQLQTAKDLLPELGQIAGNGL